MTTTQIKAGIVGGTGYTGVELIRLLSMHPLVELAWVTSRSAAGNKITDLFTSLRGVTELTFQNFDDNSHGIMREVDVVFFATPHGVAMKQTPELIKAGIKVIDLGADFRLQSLTDFEYWYKHTHTCPELLKQAVYGLSEVMRAEITNAQLIANPGCYPTTAILGLNPIIKHQNALNVRLIEPRIVIDAKSGVSGAGRQAKIGLNYAETTDNFKAYGADGHRHLPEIEQGLSSVLSSKYDHKIRFLPHLVPMIRGMFSSIHLELTDRGSEINWQQLFEEAYADEMFVDVMPTNEVADTRSVRASNRLRISICQNSDRKELTIMVVQDNLVKGAAGQAIQNMNIMFGFEESLSLNTAPVMP